MNLPPLQEEFVLHFGEMGSRWGINRTVGQIYALLFVNERPLNAEEIAESLGFSRSNVSMGLKELQAWKLVRLKHFPGDRREYFTTPADLWEIVRTLVEERKRREIDPTLTKLRELQMSRERLDGDAYANHRIEELTQLIELLSGWYDDMNGLETDRLIQLLSLGARVTDLMAKAGNVLPMRRRKGAAETDGGAT
ncbi:GbsR/MarR family transcriptional regulator [Acuticoccus sp. I52.16.1]|uniref:GbsR/MarR family transcriptional regulator n=1 Tax=Acuticoccus sp. I52.16.1 TaxID=2928472 RepID=UPI001FD0F11E|nr:GbsR/MarR family transcriptional regulator [Acuticoccus sp. I52.16.1]UOM36153.1 GbsR/MarR family transcriptional regulator [Acuticoccus sp. I52.16.1]